MYTVTKKTFSDFKPMQVGPNECEITLVAEAKPKDAPWKDVTSQLQVTFTNAEGEQLSKWFNFIGFAKYEDYANGKKKVPAGHEFMSSEGGSEKYLVKTKTLMRVPNKERTNDAIRIFLEFLEEADVADEGTEFNSIADIIAYGMKNLEGAQLGVMVRTNGVDDKGRDRHEIHHTMSLEGVQEAIAEIETADA